MARQPRHGGDHRGSARARRIRKCKLLAGLGVPGKYGVGHCAYCGCFLTWSTVEADRVQPGGPYALWNVTAACRWCNRRRSNNVEWTFGGDA